jgi:hypothetical protein
VGVPIATGVYLAWVDRDWLAKTKAIGFAAAAGGALVGAWLGFNATEGLLALFTAIVGAAVGGNLLLLTLDIAWDRQARDRSPEPMRRRRSRYGPRSVERRARRESCGLPGSQDPTFAAR